MNKLTKAQMQKNSKIAEEKLKNINLFFSVYSSFIAGIFCVFQYFFAGEKIFYIISAIGFIFVLFITYFLACSKNVIKLKKIWKYMDACTEIAGLLNPFVLALSILLSALQEECLLFLCVIILLLHIVLYIMVLIKFLKGKYE